MGQAAKMWTVASGSVAFKCRSRFDTCSARAAACPPPATFCWPGPAGRPNATRRPTLGNRDATYARVWLSVDCEMPIATAISRPPRPRSWTLTSKAAPALPSSGRHVRAPTLPFCTSSMVTPDFRSRVAPARNAIDACASRIKRSRPEDLATLSLRNASILGRMSICQSKLSRR